MNYGGVFFWIAICPIKGKFDSKVLASSGSLMSVSQMWPPAATALCLLRNQIPSAESISYVQPRSQGTDQELTPSLAPAPGVVVKLLSQ